LALDENGDPHDGGCNGCRGVVTINSTTSAITYNEEFYSLGQVTKAVQPGAVRIDSTTTSAVNTVAFLNPDGSKALIALNPNAGNAILRVNENGQPLQLPNTRQVGGDISVECRRRRFPTTARSMTAATNKGRRSLDAWTVFGNTAGNVSAAADAVLSGDKSLKLFGQSSGVDNVRASRRESRRRGKPGASRRERFHSLGRQHRRDETILRR